MYFIPQNNVFYQNFNPQFLLKIIILFLFFINNNKTIPNVSTFLILIIYKRKMSTIKSMFSKSIFLF